MKKLSAIIIAVIVAVIASIGFIRHERRQSSEIMRLREEIQFLTARTDMLVSKSGEISDAETFRDNCIKYANGGGKIT